jgi:hypothetical protein
MQKSLLGKTLQQVRFGLYQIQLVFDDDLIVSVGEKLTHKSADGVLQIWSFLDGRRNISINNLLEIKVANAQFEGGDLKIDFANDESLIIHSGTDGLESYEIRYKEQTKVFR